MAAPRVGFDEHIRRNQRTTWLVMAFMFALLWSIIFLVGWILDATPVFSAILALVIGGAYIAITYARSTKTVLLASEARPVNMENRAEKLLAFRVEEMAIASGLPVPKVYVQDSRDINAFAAGLTPETSIVCMTAGALEMLNQEELEGVIAHEMSHILNRDVRLATITVGIVGALALIAEIAARLLFFGGGRSREKAGGHPILIVLAIVGIILAPIMARLTYLFLSRQREYLADATGVKLTRNPEGLANALAKIKGDVPDHPQGSKTVAALYISNPWKRALRESVWSTHPPLDARIERLRRM